jgi:hypothetical protein
MIGSKPEWMVSATSTVAEPATFLLPAFSNYEQCHRKAQEQLSMRTNDVS